QLGYNAKDVVAFLADNAELPTRFSDKKTLEQKSVLKDPTEQFPILPPKARDRRYNDWPDPSIPDFGLTRESFDIFLVTRSWHTYSQENLPPPNPNPGVSEGRPPHPLRERMPRRPTIIIFRNFPARAQAYLAETLQEEGWFDEQGWFIKDWFRGIDQPERGLLVGDQIKYHSGLAWAKAADRYREYGRENGLYLDLADRKKLAEQAKVFERHANIKPTDRAAPPSRNAPQAIKDGFFAHEKLHWSQVHKNMTNY